MLRRILALAALLGLSVVSVAPAVASVTVKVGIGSQRMHVYVDGRLKHVWRVSTGRGGRYATPTGTFRPKRLERSWFSRKYDDAPMPHSIFFYGWYAIHGTTHHRALGRRASHGCVRLARGNAALLFSLVRRHGPGQTRISIGS